MKKFLVLSLVAAFLATISPVVRYIVLDLSGSVVDEAEKWKEDFDHHQQRKESNDPFSDNLVHPRKSDGSR